MPPAIGDKGPRMRGHRVDARTRTRSTRSSAVKAPCPAQSVSEQALRSLPAFRVRPILSRSACPERARVAVPRVHGAHAPFASSPRGLTAAMVSCARATSRGPITPRTCAWPATSIAAMRSRRCPFVQAQRWSNARVVTGSLLTVTTLYHRAAPCQRRLFAA